MDFTWKNLNVFKRVVSSLASVGECNMCFSEHGYMSRTMDSNHVFLVDHFIEKDWFRDATLTKRLALGLKVANLAKIAALSGKSTGASIRQYSKERSDTVGFEIDLPGGMSHKVDLKLMDIDVQMMGIPDFSPSVSIDMPSKTYKSLLDDLVQFGETVTIEISDSTGATFTVKGDTGTHEMFIPCKSRKQNKANKSSNDNQDTSMTFQEEERDEDGSDYFEIVCKEPFKLDFGIKFLSTFAKSCCEELPTCTWSFALDQPAIVKFPWLENGIEFGYFRYFLASKIEEASNF